jgi:hypothetical protein
MVILEKDTGVVCVVGEREAVAVRFYIRSLGRTVHRSSARLFPDYGRSSSQTGLICVLSGRLGNPHNHPDQEVCERDGREHLMIERWCVFGKGLEHMNGRELFRF